VSNRAFSPRNRARLPSQLVFDSRRPPPAIAAELAFRSGLAFSSAPHAPQRCRVGAEDTIWFADLTRAPRRPSVLPLALGALWDDLRGGLRVAGFVPWLPSGIRFLPPIRWRHLGFPILRSLHVCPGLLVEGDAGAPGSPDCESA
jgi:hypothetical protein